MTAAESAVRPASAVPRTSATTPTSSSSAPARPAAAPPTTWPRAGLDVAAAGEDEFPREKVCGDGLTPRGTRALVDMGIDVSERGRLAAQQGPAGHRRRPAAGAGLARPRPASRTTAWPAPAPTSTSCSPSRRSRPAPGCTSSTTVTGPVLDARRPGRRRAARSRPGQGAGRATARRSCSPPTACPASSPLALGMHQARRPADRRGGAPLLPQPASTTTTTSSPGWSCGTASPTSRTCCPATAGSSAWATAGSTSASACSTRRRRSEDQLPRDAHRLAGQHADGVGAARGRTPTARSAAPRCRWASTACRTTRAGVLLVGDSGGMVNPFNGEGIAVRDGVGRARRRGRRAGAGPAGRAGARAGAAGLPDAAAAHESGGYYRLGGVFVKLIGNPKVMRRAPGTACRTRR